MKKQPSLFIFSMVLMTVMIAALFGSVPIAQAQDGTPPPADDISGQIVGGQLANPGEWPWQVALVDSNAVAPHFYNYQFCGGSLINPFWVLTAAHCVTENNGSLSPASSINIVAGIYNLNTPSAGYQRRSVTQIIRHENYNPNTTDFDVALLRLDSPVTLGGSGAARTGLIPLVPAAIGNLAGVNSWVTGWGDTTGTGSYPEQLREVNVPIISNVNCNTKYGGGITSNMLCAGYSGHDSCFGDSGGPLMVTNSGQFQQAGIVSWGGNICGDPTEPGVYTRVSQFVDWINASRGPSVLSITRGAANPTSSSAVTFIVTFSENVNGVDPTDFTLTQSGVSGASIDLVTPVSANVYTVTVSTGTGTGTLGLDVADDDSIFDTDTIAKSLGEAGAGNGAFNSGASYVIRPIAETYYSQKALDGWVLESAEASNIGGTINAATTTFNLGDDAARKQYRSVLSFKTSGLPDGAIIAGVTLKVKKAGITGSGNPVTIFQGFMADIKKGTLGASVLAAADFQASASQTLGPFKPALSGGWYSIDLTSAQGYINKLGLTQIRLRFKSDDNNNGVANFLKLYSGSAPATSRPQLIIEYTLP